MDQYTTMVVYMFPKKGLLKKNEDIENRILTCKVGHLETILLMCSSLELKYRGIFIKVLDLGDRYFDSILSE